MPILVQGGIYTSVLGGGGGGEEAGEDITLYDTCPGVLIYMYIVPGFPGLGGGGGGVKFAIIVIILIMG